MAHRRRNRRRRRGSLGPLLRVLSVLLTAVAVVAALTLFFKVDQVVVSGNSRYSAEEIIEVSGVEQGDNLILMDKYHIAEKLYTELPYITEVRINRKLPDVLMVEVVETQAVAAIKGGSSTWLMDSGGKLLEVVSASMAKKYITLEGLTAESPAISGKLKLGEESPISAQRLLELSAYMRRGLTQRGIPIRESATPIIPIYTYEATRTLQMAKRLYEAEVYVNPVLPPATPATECLLRTSYMATLTEALLDEALDIFERVLKGHGEA